MFGTPSYYVQELFGQNRGDVVLPTVVSGTTSLYASSSLLRSNGQIIVKAVNPGSTSLATTFNVTGVNSIASSATVIQLTSTSGSVLDENSLSLPTYVFPVPIRLPTREQFLVHAPGPFTFHYPAHCQRHQFLYKPAVTIHFAHQQRPTGRGHGLGTDPASGSISPPMPITPSLTLRRTRASRSWTAKAILPARVRGRRALLPLTRVWVCTPRNPYRSSMSRRHSCIVTASTMARRNDSVGGTNGTLHGNATISGGQLVLPNTTSVAPATDYLQLPAGILTNNPAYGIGTNDNDPAVTVEAWATIKAGQYTWANLFDFGNRDASGQSEYKHSCVCLRQ